MALKLQVEKLEDLEEGLRPLYEEKDGKFVLSVDGIEDPTPYKKTIESLRKVERERGREIDNWKKLGLTPDEINEKLEKLQELEELKLEHKGDFETLKQQWLEKNESRIKKAEERAANAEADRARIQAEKEQDRLEVLIDRAIASNKGKMRPLKPIVKQFVKIEHVDGQVKYVAYDENGEPWVNDKMTPVSINEMVSEMAGMEDYADLFEGSGNSGGGARPGAGGNQKGPPMGIRTKKDFGTGKEYHQKFEAWNKLFPTAEEATRAYVALPD
jgi:hypothetical protein